MIANKDGVPATLNGPTERDPFNNNSYGTLVDQGMRVWTSNIQLRSDQIVNLASYHRMPASTVRQSWQSSQVNVSKIPRASCQTQFSHCRTSIATPKPTCAQR